MGYRVWKSGIVILDRCVFYFIKNMKIWCKIQEIIYIHQIRVLFTNCRFKGLQHSILIIGHYKKVSFLFASLTDSLAAPLLPAVPADP